MMRSRHGRKPVFDGPDKLEEACLDYFEWVEANPLYEDKIGFYEGDAIHTPAAKMRAMTLGGLCIFIDILIDTWIDWRKNREDLSHVIKWAENIIKIQKFEGASAGLLNANIIARDLGLGDKTEIQALDAKGNPADLPGYKADLDAYNAKLTNAIEKGLPDGEE